MVWLVAWQRSMCLVTGVQCVTLVEWFVRTWCGITFKAIHVSLGRNRKYNTVRWPNTGNKPKTPNQCNSQPKPKPKKRQSGYITAFCLLKYQSHVSSFPKITPSMSLAAGDIYSAGIFLSSSFVKAPVVITDFNPLVCVHHLVLTWSLFTDLRHRAAVSAFAQ